MVDTNGIVKGTSPRAEGPWVPGEYAEEQQMTMTPTVSQKVAKPTPFGRAFSVYVGDNHHEAQTRNDKSIFVDVAAMKERVRKNLSKEETPDVSYYYYKEGLWPWIATHSVFERVTLSVIALNAVWIGIDTDYNSADVLLHAEPLFQIAEQSFCVYFTFEWFVRFRSFEDKRNCVRDAWFVFDSVLVLLMVLETWVLTVVMLISGSASGNGIGNASILRMARLARLTRMTRMARLLRAMPELMILIKGIVAATRSVFFTLALLCLLLYIFAIAFTQMTAGTDPGDMYFSGVGESMLTLLTFGALMDQISQPLHDLGEIGYGYAALYLLFILLATITLMNMLIGVLCEVVSAIATTEKESLTVAFVKNKIQQVLSEIDENGDGNVSKEEFKQILESRDAIEALSDVGVDVVELVDFADFIFADEELGQERILQFGEFMDVVLQFRGCNAATVKDVVDLRKVVAQRLHDSRDDMQELRRIICANLPNPAEISQARRTSRSRSASPARRSVGPSAAPALDTLDCSRPRAIALSQPLLQAANELPPVELPWPLEEVSRLPSGEPLPPMPKFLRRLAADQGDVAPGPGLD